MNPQSPPPADECLREFGRIEQRTPTDCERCCFAMMLGLRYEDVPDFFNEWASRKIDTRREWLRARGYDFIELDYDLSPPASLPFALCIAGVESPSQHPAGHAVIGRVCMDGDKRRYETVYDPSPEREKSGKEPSMLSYLVPMNPRAAWKPEQAPAAGAEPVAWMVCDKGWNQCFTTLEQASLYGKELTPLYLAPPAPSAADELTADDAREILHLIEAHQPINTRTLSSRRILARLCNMLDRIAASPQPPADASECCGDPEKCGTCVDQAPADASRVGDGK